MSIGGRSSSEQSQSSSQSTSDRFGFNQSGSFIDQNQQPFLTGLYQNATDQFGLTQPDMTNLTNSSVATGGQAVSNLLGLGNAQNVIDAQLTGLNSGLTDIYNQGVNQIGDNAIQAGAFGSSRQGVAEGVLGGEIGKAYTQGYGDIIANANRQSIDANNSAIAGAGQNIVNQLQGDFGGLQALAGILGNPTVLQQSFGMDGGTSQASMQSTGEAESGGFNLGFSEK
jgi:hypothetical protein